MTQFPPPPDAPGPMPAESYNVPAHQPQRWSTAAVAGFVLSLLGCVGLTAILGFVFGIIGIVATRGGRRRGLGLAVAAIPISLVTGMTSVFLITAAVMVASVAPQVGQLRKALESPDTVAAVATVRSFCSDTFNEMVSDEELNTWLQHVRTTHGKLVHLQQSSGRPVKTADGTMSFTQEAKFVNGPASITIKFAKDGFMHLRIDNIAIDGVSLRRTD